MDTDKETPAEYFARIRAEFAAETPEQRRAGMQAAIDEMRAVRMEMNRNNECSCHLDTECGRHRLIAVDRYAALVAAEERTQRLEAALQHYANPANWRLGEYDEFAQTWDYGYGPEDGYRLARDVLMSVRPAAAMGGNGE